MNQVLAGGIIIGDGYVWTILCPKFARIFRVTRMKIVAKQFVCRTKRADGEFSRCWDLPELGYELTQLLFNCVPLSFRKLCPELIQWNPVNVLPDRDGFTLLRDNSGYFDSAVTKVGID